MSHAACPPCTGAPARALTGTFASYIDIHRGTWTAIDIHRGTWTAWLVAVLLAVIATRPANAQVPLVPDAIATPDLQPIIETLGLSDQQALTLLPIHDTYKERYRTFLDTDVKKLQDQLVEIGLRFTRGRFEIPERKELEGIVSDFKRLLERSRSLDRGFFVEIGGILAEDQMPRLEQARINRELTIYRQILGGVGEMNRGAGVNLAEMTRRLDLSPQEREQVEPVLAQYESTLLAKSNDIYNILTDIAKVVLDFIDETGIRNMTLEQMAAMAQNPPPDLMTRAQNIFDEASKPIQQGAYEVSQLNLRTYRNLAPLLSSEHVRDLRDRYFRRAYREIYNGDSRWERRYRRALQLEELTDEQRTAITEQRDSYTTQFDAAVDAGVAALESSRQYRSFRQFSQQDPDPAKEKLDDTIARRTSIEDQANNTLDALLGEALVAAVDKDLEQDPDLPAEQRQARVRAQARARAAGPGEAQAEVRIEGQDAAQAIVQLEGALETEESRYLPAPMNPQQFEKVLSEVRLTDDDRATAMAFFDTYRAAYDKLRVEPLKIQKEGEESTPTETAKARSSRHEELIALDHRVFDDLALLLVDDATKQTLESIRQMRLRSAASDVAKVLAQSFGNDEAYIDIVAMVIGSELSAEDRTHAWVTMTDYQARIAGHVQQRLEDSRDVRRRSESMERAQRRRDGGGGTGGGAGQAIQFAMEKWREARASLSATNDKITAINREVLDQLAAALSSDAAWQVRLAYNQAAYPEIFRDDRGAEKSIQGALALPDLDDSQRERINEIAAQYRADFYALCEQMVGLRRQRDFDMLAGQMPQKEDIDREIELEKMRWNRNELGARARLKLSLILTDDQAKNLPELQSR